MSFICSPAETPSPVVRILAELLHCCYGAVEDGPSGCTCWVPEYDLEQQPAVEVLAPGQRTEMCADCAYRPDSPERNGDERQACSGDGELDEVALGDAPFWCHVGLRKPVRFRHETLGITVPADVDAYDPPFATVEIRAWSDSVVRSYKVPIKADGTAGDRCAGWAARKKQLLAAESG